MIKKVIYLIILSILFSSCKVDEEKEDNQLVSLKFTFSEISKNYNDFFEKTQLIPLQKTDDCLLAEISQIEIKNDTIYILDSKSRSICAFNDSGKYLFKIGNVGNGPGEFIRPKQILHDSINSRILIYDSASKKIISYNSQGEFQKEIKIEYYLHKLFIKGNEFWGFCSNIPNENQFKGKKRSLKFVIFDSDGEIKDLVYGPHIKDDLHHGDCNISQLIDDEIFFIEALNNKVYSFDGSKIEDQYLIDFSGFSPPSKALDRFQNLKVPLSNSDIKFRNNFYNSYSALIPRYFENEKWVILFSQFKNTTLIYNKNDDSFRENSNALYNKEGWEFFAVPIYLSGDNLYSSIHPWQLEAMTSSSSAVPKISDKRRNQIVKVLEDIEQDDNPIIIKYLIK